MPRKPWFEFTVEGPALSAQTRNRRRLLEWKHKVAAAARLAWTSGAPPVSDHLDVAVSEFSAFASRDRDNTIKPVLDAMQGVVYVNDRQIKRHSIEWCDINGSYIVRYMSPLVASALSVGEDFLWIRMFTHQHRSDLTG